MKLSRQIAAFVVLRSCAASLDVVAYRPNVWASSLASSPLLRISGGRDTGIRSS
jgi:hypothetical protein